MTPRQAGIGLRRLTWLGIYATVMAFVESAVVVYLRLHYYPGGFRFPMRMIPEWVGAIEIGREVATLVMLLAVSVLAGEDRWERFLGFCFSFGVWDIFYYIWLWVFLQWPPSLFTFDVLFLIPVVWVGPVLAPVIVAVLLVLSAAKFTLVGMFYMHLKQDSALFSGLLVFPIFVAVALIGALIVLFSYMSSLF